MKNKTLILTSNQIETLQVSFDSFTIRLAENSIRVEMWNTMNKFENIVQGSPDSTNFAAPGNRTNEKIVLSGSWFSTKNVKSPLFLIISLHRTNLDLIFNHEII